MKEPQKNLTSMTGDQKRSLLKHLLKGKEQQDSSTLPTGEIPEEFYRLNKLPGYRKLMEQKQVLRALEIDNPYFAVHEGVSDHITQVNGKEYIDYSRANYLGLSGHPEVSAAAKKAIDEYGMSVASSRLVSGEIPLYGELEKALACIHNTEDALALVSGYLTNVAVIAHLFGPNDLLLHDSLIHNSVVAGCKLSGARRVVFPHNDWRALNALLEQNRGQHERVLIIIEGVYSMDGDIPDLPRFIEAKWKHKCLLMVDDAHAVGVIGARGLGSHDYFNIDAAEVDIWIGTFSKSFGSGGGYVCGSKALIENIKYTAPGAVLFSVAISPPNAGAALAAAKIIMREPERAERLRARSRFFLDCAKQRGLNTGLAVGTGVVSIVLGNSIHCLQLGQRLGHAGINVYPIIHPAVPEESSRLRFFININHTEEEMVYTVDTLAREIAALR